MTRLNAKNSFGLLNLKNDKNTWINVICCILLIVLITSLLFKLSPFIVIKFPLKFITVPDKCSNIFKNESCTPTILLTALLSLIYKLVDKLSFSMI